MWYPDDKDYSWFRWGMASAFGWTLTRDQSARLAEGHLNAIAEKIGLESTPESTAYNAWKAQRPNANGPDRVYFQKDADGNITRVFILGNKASGRTIGASTFNSGRNRSIDQSIDYLKIQNDPAKAMGEQLYNLQKTGVPIEGVAVGTSPGGRWRGSFTTNVQGAKGGLVLDEKGNVQEGSAWGSMLKLMPRDGATGSPQAPPLLADQD